MTRYYTESQNTDAIFNVIGYNSSANPVQQLTDGNLDTSLSERETYTWNLGDAWYGRGNAKVHCHYNIPSNGNYDQILTYISSDGTTWTSLSNTTVSQTSGNNLLESTYDGGSNGLSGIYQLKVAVSGNQDNQPLLQLVELLIGTSGHSTGDYIAIGQNNLFGTIQKAGYWEEYGVDYESISQIMLPGITYVSDIKSPWTPFYITNKFNNSLTETEVFLNSPSGKTPVLSDKFEFSADKINWFSGTYKLSVGTIASGETKTMYVRNNGAEWAEVGYDSIRNKTGIIHGSLPSGQMDYYADTFFGRIVVEGKIVDYDANNTERKVMKAIALRCGGNFQVYDTDISMTAESSLVNNGTQYPGGMLCNGKWNYLTDKMQGIEGRPDGGFGQGMIPLVHIFSPFRIFAGTKGQSYITLVPHIGNTYTSYQQNLVVNMSESLTNNSYTFNDTNRDYFFSLPYFGTSIRETGYESYNEIGLYFNQLLELHYESFNDCIKINPEQTIEMKDSPYGRQGYDEEVEIINTSEEYMTDVSVSVVNPPYMQRFQTTETYQDFVKASSELYKYLEISKDRSNWVSMMQYLLEGQTLNGKYLGNLDDALDNLLTIDPDMEKYIISKFYAKRLSIGTIAPHGSTKFYIRTKIPFSSLLSDSPQMGLIRIMGYVNKSNGEGYRIANIPVYINGNRKYCPERFVQGHNKKLNKGQSKLAIRYFGSNREWMQNKDLAMDIDDINLKLGINKTASTLDLQHKRRYEEIGEIDTDCMIAVFGNSENNSIDFSSDIIFVGNVTQVGQSDDDSSILQVQAIDALHELNYNTVNYVYINRTAKDIVKHIIDEFYKGTRVSYTDESIGGTYDENGNYVTDEPVNISNIEYIIFNEENIPNAIDRIAKQVGANFWIEPRINENGDIEEILYFRVPNTYPDKVYYRKHDIQNFKKTQDSSQIINEIKLIGGNVVERIEGKSSFNNINIFSDDTKQLTTEYPIDTTSSSGTWKLYALPQGMVEGVNVMNFVATSGEESEYYHDTYLSGFWSSYFPVKETMIGSGTYSDWNFLIVKGTNAGLKGRIITSTNSNYDLLYTNTMTNGKDLFVGLDFNPPDGFTNFNTTGEDQDQFWIYPDNITNVETTVSGIGINNMGFNYFSDSDVTITNNNIIFNDILPNIKKDSANKPIFENAIFVANYDSKWSDERETLVKRTGKVQESVEIYGSRKKTINDNNITSYSAADLVILSELDKSAFPSKSIEFDLPFGDISLKRNELINIRGFYHDQMKDKSFYNKNIIGNTNTKWNSKVPEDAEIKNTSVSISHTYKNGLVQTHVNLNNEEPRYDETLKDLFDIMRKTSTEYNPLEFWNDVSEKIERPKDYNSTRHYNKGLDYGLKLERYNITTQETLPILDNTKLKHTLSTTFTSGYVTNEVIGQYAGSLVSGTISTGFINGNAIYFSGCGTDWAETFTTPRQNFMNYPFYTLETVMKYDTGALAGFQTYDMFYNIGRTGQTIDQIGIHQLFGNYSFTFTCSGTNYNTSLAVQDIIGGPIDDGKWHYYAFIRNDVSGKVYIDGTYVGETVSLPANSTFVEAGDDLTLPLEIGRFATDTHTVNLYNGSTAVYIDTIAMHSGILTEDQIKSRYDIIKNASQVSKIQQIEI
jgi:hypothetical protein